jgi:3'-phosphoadenosine 5'-phosphosulfate sulfotransferase (PAPS reductase)/FAD synthetase
MTLDAIDGVALGIRASESRARTINLAQRGLIYRSRDRWVCQPIAHWSADMVVGALIDADRLPINPVYHRALETPGVCLERIRDGTWWPVASEQRSWLAAHYPSVLELYDRALNSHGSRRERDDW